MYIDGSGCQRFMSHKSFNGKQIGAVFIQVCTKGMSKGMACKPVRPSQPVLVGMDMPGKEKGVNGAIFTALFWKKKPHWPVAFKPVPGKKIKGSFGEDGIAVLPAFRVRDMKSHIFTVNIFIP